MSKLAVIFTLAITAGQLIRFPFGPGSINLLDLFITGFVIFHLLKLKFKLKKPPAFIMGAILFGLIAILSLTFSPLKLTLPQILVSFSYIARFLFYIMFAWISFNLPPLRLAGVALAVLGLLQIIILPDLSFLTILGWDPHYFRLVSTFLDPNFTGAFLVLTLLLLPRPSLWFWVVYLALLLTFSRSSYGMFLISFSTLAWLQKSLKLQIITLALFAGLMSGFFLYTLAVSQPRNIDRAESASLRLNTWQQGWQIFEKHPLLGVGFNAYRFALAEFDLGGEQFLKSHGSSGNDASLLFVLATTGILGLASFMFFLYLLIRKGGLVTAAVTGLLFHSLFANSLFFPPILLWLILISSSPKK
ncbi:O-antigen ligase family protein [Candidatus Daviesbacteria bacterium]|nr:O-antigen ligase family protein [Candidatus Daviesbacteria bacterium]